MPDLRREIPIATRVKAVCPTCGGRLRRHAQIDGHTLTMVEKGVECTACGKVFERQVAGIGKAAVTTFAATAFKPKNPVLVKVTEPIKEAEIKVKP